MVQNKNIPDRALIVVADVITLKELRKIVRDTRNIPGCGGYKIGFSLCLTNGIRKVVKAIKELTDLPIIFDFQKAGNDIPLLAKLFADTVDIPGIDSVILFPFASALTQEKWTEELIKRGMTVIVGGHMTQDKFLESEGGYIADDSPVKIYTLAAKQGVRNFVMPGNKLEYVNKYIKLLDEIIGVGNYTVWSPGFINQHGVLTEFVKVAGQKFRIILGSEFLTPKNRETYWNESFLK